MEKNENIEIKRILDILKSKKIFIALILIVFTLLGYWYSYHYLIPKYKSATTLLLIPNTISENKTETNLELVMNAELINTYSNIATNSKVLKQTIQNLGLDMSETKLLRQVQVNIIDNTYIIEIVVSNTDPQKSMEIANELAKVFLQEIKQIYNLNNIGVVDEAQLARGPYNVNHGKDIVIFFAIGMMFSFACIMIIYIFDNTIKKEEDIENYIKVKSLGNIPIHNDKKQEIIDSNHAKSYITECMNTIRTNILYMNSAKNAKTILITSCTPQEGKSWVSANIATSFAKVNKKVLLIDADMRKGRAHKIFKAQNAKGLSNYLNSITGNVKKDIKLGKEYIQETKIPNLHILTNGTVPPNPSELLGSKNMKELVALLKNVYDIIIVDAPPCKLVTDSIVLSTIMDSTVLVVNAEKTKINDLKDIRKSIEVVGGQIIGAILNKKKVSQKTYSKNDYYALTKQNESKKVEEKQIISVEQVIGQAILKLRKTDFDIFPVDNELAVEQIEKQETLSLKESQKQQDIKELIKKQNEYLVKMIVNHSTNYTQELNKILNQLEETKQNHLTSNKMKEIVKEEIANLQDREQEKLTEGQMKEIIREEIANLEPREQEKLTEGQMKEIIREEIANLEPREQEKLTEGQMKEIIREEIANLEPREQEKLTEEQMKEIIREEIANLESREQEKVTKEQIESIIKQQVSHIDYSQDIEKIYLQIQDAKANTSEIIKEKQTLLEQEIMKMNYTEQIVQINEMLTNLKDSYLELSNQVKKNNTQIEENVDIGSENNKNIIDFKAFKKQKNKKKVYSIDEDIFYHELEKTATCIIPIQGTKSENSSAKKYFYL